MHIFGDSLTAKYQEHYTEKLITYERIHLLVGERIAILQPCVKPGSTPMMTEPLMGDARRRWRRLRTNMSIDSFSAVADNLVLNGNTHRI